MRRHQTVISIVTLSLLHRYYILFPTTIMVLPTFIGFPTLPKKNGTVRPPDSPYRIFYSAQTTSLHYVAHSKCDVRFEKSETSLSIYTTHTVFRCQSPLTSIRPLSNLQMRLTPRQLLSHPFHLFSTNIRVFTFNVFNSSS
jgi:hypothetical protein